MLKKALLVLSLLALLAPVPGRAQEGPIGADQTPGEAFYRATVLEVVKEEWQEAGESSVLNQTLKVRLDSGPEKGKELTIENSAIASQGIMSVKPGQKVVVYYVDVQGESAYYIADAYRLPSLIFIVLLFFVLAIAFSRWKGVASILGLLVSVAVIAKFIVPQIVAGRNPVAVSLVGALMIALISIYLSHGFNKRTSVALFATLITLALSALLAFVFVAASKLFGLGSEQAFYLQFGLENLNLQGLLLGGIILGALGVLDDITTAQAATIDELKKANPAFTFRELYKSGLSVGREHIAALVNTLFLAYAGAALPLFLFFTVNNPQPLWVTLNAEFIAEEVVRTLVGSISLILAVPITNFLAAYYFTKKGPTDAPGHAHAH